jgi:DNA repair protein RadA/Sms
MSPVDSRHRACGRFGVATAIASSFRDCPIDPRTVIMGEVGLGEVRAIPHLEGRLREAENWGSRRP